MNKVTIKITKIKEKAKIPEYQTDGASGMDLCACLEEDILLEPLARKLVPTGLKMELPKGYEAQVRPRSGMSIKHGITLINCVGTIDSDYRGEIQVPLVNLGQEDFEIKNGERIAQMVIAKYEQISWKITDELSETERGAGGFGHTGR